MSYETLTDSLDLLLSYTPTIVRRHYFSHADHTAFPSIERHYAAILYIELDGFGALLEQANPAQIEALDHYFNSLFGLLNSYGGEVTQVDNQHALAVWSLGVLAEDLQTITRRAADCALQLCQWHQQQSENLQHLSGTDAHKPSFQILLDAGAIWHATLGTAMGGVGANWQFMLAGPVLHFLRAVDTHPAPNQVLVTPAGWSLLRAYAEGEHCGHYLRLQHLSQRLTPFSVIPPEASQANAAQLQQYLSPFLLKHLEQHDENAQESTIVAAHISGFEPFDPLTPNRQQRPLMRQWLTQMQDVFYDLQQVLENFQGNLLRLGMESQGLVLVAVWDEGSDDAAYRAVQATTQAVFL